MLLAGVARGQGTVAMGMPEDYLPGLRVILERALEQAPQSIARNIDVAQAEANEYAARSILWPSLSGSISYSTSTQQVSTSSVSSTADGFFYGANIGQALFQWGAVRAQAEIGTIGVRIAEKNYADAYRLLAMLLRRDYLTLISRKVSLGYLRIQLEQSQRTLGVEEEKLKNGAISSGAIIVPRLATQELQLSVDRAASDLEFLVRTFARLSGSTDLSIDALPSGFERPQPAPATADALLAEFLGGGVDETLQNQVYELYLKQSDLSYRIAKTRLLPKFSFSAGYSLSNSTSASADSISQVAVSGYNYGITGSWTIFDGFASRGAKLSALLTRRAYERQRANYVEGAMESAQQLRKSVDFSVRALEIAELRRAIASDAVRIAREDAALGASADSDVDLVVARFQVADLAALTARADYLNRWAEFVSTTGADPVLNNLPARYVRKQP